MALSELIGQLKVFVDRSWLLTTRQQVVAGLLREAFVQGNTRWKLRGIIVCPSELIFYVEEREKVSCSVS